MEQEMQKRRERIEKWRAEKKKREMESMKQEAVSAAQEINAVIEAKSGGKWSLEDDNDDEEGGASKEGKNAEEEDEDPLDAYMAEVQKEVKKLKGVGGIVKGTKANDTQETNNGTEGKKKGIVIMTGVAKKQDANKKPSRGELVEQNQDGLEYSSEDEEAGLEDAMNKIANKGKKDLIKIDHNKIDYQPFVKEFYREVPELARMTPAEVEAYREELEGIRVKGKNVPKPIKTWSQCGVSSKILEILKKNNYEKPTPIQV